MLPPVFAAASGPNPLWFFLPLVLAVSLVYGATRHEHMGPILHHALRAGVWILSFMGGIFLVLLVISWLL